MTKYIIKDNSVWYDDLDWKQCEPLEIFTSRYQAVQYVLNKFGTYRVVK